MTSEFKVHIIHATKSNLNAINIFEVIINLLSSIINQIYCILLNHYIKKKVYV